MATGADAGEVAGDAAGHEMREGASNGWCVSTEEVLRVGAEAEVSGGGKCGLETGNPDGDPVEPTLGVEAESWRKRRR